MKSYDDFKNEENGGVKCSLFNRLKKAIEGKDSGTAEEILTSGDKYLQEVLGTSIIEESNGGTTESFTFLTYAIEFGEIDVAQAILDTASQDVLEELLHVESIIRRIGGTKKFTALRLAEGCTKKKGYADLANKIREKLGIPTLDLDENDESLWFPKEGHTKRTEEIKRKKNELLKKDAESLGSPDSRDEGLVPSGNRDENFTIRRTSNNLFWAVLLRKGEVVKNILESSRNQGYTAHILKVGLIRLCIGDKRAEALATKGDREIIRDIKTGQSLVISLIGLMMVAFTIAAIVLIISTAPVPMTAVTIAEIVTVGFTGIAISACCIGFAVYHDSYKIPDTQLEKVGQNAVSEGLVH